VTIGGSNQLIWVISKCELIGRRHMPNTLRLRARCGTSMPTTQLIAQFDICLVRVREDALEFLCRAVCMCVSMSGGLYRMCVRHPLR